jgi:hypothetical protein
MFHPTAAAPTLPLFPTKHDDIRHGIDDIA